MSDDLVRLHQEIRGCTRCVAAGYLTEAIPIVRGRADQRLMVIGQAPGINPASRQMPWSGTSGNVLCGWLERIGVDSDTWRDTCYLTSITKCFPGRTPSGSGDRAPSRGEQALCRPYLDREIALIQPALVITLGRLAAAALLPELRAQTMTAFIGRVFQPDLGYGPVPLMPLPHPSGVSRWLNVMANRTLVEDGLGRLHEIYGHL